MGIWIGYIGLIILCFLNIPSILSGIISLPLALLKMGMFFISISTGAIVWLGIFLIWGYIFKSLTPVLAVSLGVFIQYYLYPTIQKKELTIGSKKQLQGELIGSVLISLYFFIKFNDLIRWY
jgi:hypothetical protein